MQHAQLIYQQDHKTTVAQIYKHTMHKTRQQQVPPLQIHILNNDTYITKQTTTIWHAN